MRVWRHADGASCPSPNRRIQRLVLYKARPSGAPYNELFCSAASLLEASAQGQPQLPPHRAQDRQVESQLFRMLYGFNRVVEWKHVVAVSTERLRDGVGASLLVADNKDSHGLCIIAP